ncbi:hypothetical protein KM043_008295 [Ampulex compressa]|nr:hypothetical protein KM043_008295 [Ampulex compressa]
MDVLPMNFKILSFCGAWREHEQKNLIKHLVLLCHKYVIIIVIYHFTICEMIDLILARDNIKDLTERLFSTLEYMTMCFKFGNFLFRKKEMSSLLDYFRLEVCQSRNFAEWVILEKYNRKAKFCTLSFLTLSEITGLALVVAPLLENKSEDRALPFKFYTPYSTSDLLLYWITYVEQTAGVLYGVLLNVTFDSLVYGCTIQICGQIELLCYRLTEIFKNVQADRVSGTRSCSRILLGECVQHHVLIQKLVKRTQSLFMWTVIVLFFFSLITICTSIFQMSKKKLLSADFLSLALFLGCMFFQIFMYCWYGNELELKSKNIGNAIYASNWVSANVQERKSLWIIMIISQKGLALSYYGMFAMALNTFMWIMKTSYSAFSLLQQVSV